MIVLLLPFLVAGLTIMYFFGIKPSIENKPTIKKHYQEKKNEQNKN